MNKTALTSQLKETLRHNIGVAVREMGAAVDAVREGADVKTRREDSRMAIEFGALARGQRRRVQQGKQMLTALERFHPERLPRDGKVRVGSIVEIEDEERIGKTFFLAPAGAGIELTGPGGDGLLSVVTPQSPIGTAVMGLEVGDCLDVTVERKTRSWEITWVD